LDYIRKCTENIPNIPHKYSIISSQWQTASQPPPTIAYNACYVQCARQTQGVSLLPRLYLALLVPCVSHPCYWKPKRCCTVVTSPFAQWYTIGNYRAMFHRLASHFLPLGVFIQIRMLSPANIVTIRINPNTSIISYFDYYPNLSSSLLIVSACRFIVSCCCRIISRQSFRPSLFTARAPSPTA
jgi:hypothetical protein